MPARSWPASSTRPASGASKPASRRSSVVLPQPDGPSSAKNSRSWISSVTPSTAAKSPKRLVICSKLTSAAMRHANHIWPRCETGAEPATSNHLPGRLVVFGFRGRRRERGRWRNHLLHRLVEQLARLRAVIVAEPHHRARAREDRDDAVEQRLAGNRLLEEFVDAEPRGLDHAPALDVAGEHDDRHIRHR